MQAQKEGGVAVVRLTDWQKKEILSDYVELGSYNAVSKIHGVCRQTVKNIVDKNPEVRQALQQKKEENSADIVKHMDNKKNVVCEIIDKGLTALNDPDKLAEATPSQITTALGTLIDKWALIQEKAGSGKEKVEVIIDV